MDKDKLIQELKEQNQLLLDECKAADKMSEAVRALFENTDRYGNERRWERYVALRRAWQTAKDARLATEPPF